MDASRSEPLARTASWRRPLTTAVLVVALVGALPAPVEAEPSQNKEDLLVGYSLLAQTLGSEEKLKYLLWLREATFQGPGKEVERLMTLIYEKSGKLSAELEKLRELSPRVTGTPPASPIGDAIQAAAQWNGTKEMLFPDGKFGVRFVLLQAQATRMVAVIAKQTAKIDPNPKRKKWLETVGEEFEGFREQFVKAMEKCELR